jgi:hypothetical protein
MGENLDKMANEAKSAAPAGSSGAFADLRKVIVHAHWQLDRTIAAAAIEHPPSGEADRLLAFVRRSQP